MIIRKPYAFLIKYFQLIHIILFVSMTYLVYKSRGLYLFFKSFSSTGTYTYVENIAFKYINVWMIVICIMLVGLLLAIYFLMKQKEKKVLYYLLAIIFYFLSFCSYIFFISRLSQLEFITYSNQELVLFRDISMVLYYLNYIFLTVSFIRGFGFNVKKFNFEKDLKELDISDEDREEIEVKGIDYDNINIFLRRRKRNILYYFKENSFILIVFLVIIILSSTAYISYKKFVVDKVYEMHEIININNIIYNINNSYIVNKDINGNIYRKNKSYLIVDLNIKNTINQDIKLDLSNTRIKIGDKYNYYKEDISNKFLEFGKIYKKQAIKSNSNDNYILVFEIDNNNYTNILLELFEKSSNDKNYYKDVNLTFYEFKEQDLGEYKLNDEINLDKTYFNYGKFSIIDTELLDIENYTYKKCFNDKCLDYNKSVVPSANKKILKIEYSLNVNKNIFNYLKLDGNVKVNNNIKDITPNNYLENTILLEVPNDVSKDNLVLVFDIRNSIFKVKI